MRRWYTSDPHLWHKNMAREGKNLCNRPYDTVVEMNADIIRRANEVVGDNDELWILGDLAMNKRAIPEFGKLKGVKHLILGNHDDGHPCHGAKANKALALYEPYFKSVQLSARHTLGGREVLLHHMPYARQEPGAHGEKYAEWRPTDEGLWLLHGHVHTTWKTRGRMINVGVDQWDFTPVSEDTLIALIEELEKKGLR